MVSGGATPSFAEIEYDATSPDLTIGTYTYTDQDRNPSDTITWDLSGTDETHFNIGSATGVLSFDMRPDYENPFGADNVYVIVVEADDGQGGVGTYNVVVGVTNVDETPAITGGSDTPSFAEIEWDANMADLVVETFTARGRGRRSHHLVAGRRGRERLQHRLHHRSPVLCPKAQLRGVDRQLPPRQRLRHHREGD